MSIVKNYPEYVAKRGEGMRYVVIFRDPKKPGEEYDVRIFGLEEITGQDKEGGIDPLLEKLHPRQGMKVVAWACTPWFENIEQKVYQAGIRELKRMIFGTDLSRHPYMILNREDLMMEKYAHGGQKHILDVKERMKKNPRLKTIKDFMGLMNKP
ncbi:MAG: hypothetical protein ISN29_03030 [Gammaproteobacteria bacterium AqS3]|nr:hypothetical protein [Gammaproteobacteria bacterium AqS3]